MFDRAHEGKYWDFGWQLIEGCTRVSSGCDHCWSLAMEKRFRKGPDIKFHNERLHRPFFYKKPTSFSIWNDLFHESLSFEQIDQVFDTICQCLQHIFLILTKRPENALRYFMWLGNQLKKIGFDSIPSQSEDLLNYVGEIPNVWFGTTVEHPDYLWRIGKLLQVPAKFRFVSCEPLLSEINLHPFICKYGDIKKPEQKYSNICETSEKINWVIAGPETGPGARPMKREWIESLYQQCRDAGVPFFDKKNVLGLNIHQYPKYE
jgi:protein gp37